MKPATTRAGMSGFTLVEMLVGVTMGVLVIGTLSAVFVPSVTTYRNSQAVSSLQENERYAVSVLGNSLMQSGFFGCNCCALCVLGNRAAKKRNIPNNLCQSGCMSFFDICKSFELDTMMSAE